MSEGKIAGKDQVIIAGVSEKEELAVALSTVSVTVTSIVDWTVVVVVGCSEVGAGLQDQQGSFQGAFDTHTRSK